MAINKNKFPWIDVVEEKMSGCMFMDRHSYPMWFTLCTQDAEFKEQLTKFIEFCGGRVCKSLNDMNPYAVVLVDDNCTYWSHPGDVFKISYIESCYTARRCQDITDYRKNSESNIMPGFNYMDILYNKKYTWDEIPAEFIIKTTKAPTKKNVNVEENNEEEMICDSSSDSVQVTDVQVTEYTKKKDLFQGNAKSYDKQNNSQSSSIHQKVVYNINKNIEEDIFGDTSCDSVFVIDDSKKNTIKAKATSTSCDKQLAKATSTSCDKRLARATSTSCDKHTRMGYNQNEKEAILKYIIQNEGSTERIKGSQLWKNMEEDKVCRIRTWQSMREHFLKKIMFDLSSFKFLTPTQVHELKVAFASK